VARPAGMRPTNDPAAATACQRPSIFAAVEALLPVVWHDHGAEVSQLPLSCGAGRVALF